MENYEEALNDFLFVYESYPRPAILNHIVECMEKLELQEKRNYIQSLCAAPAA